MQQLKGKVALITGGSGGIGLATAQLFQEHGASVIVTGRASAALDQARQVLGPDALVLRSDGASLAEIDLLVSAVKERHGRIDVLFVNAGEGRIMPLEQVSEDQFDATVGINFKGVFFLIQKALGLFSPKAAVIVTTSITNQLGSPNCSLYAASKAALRSLVQSLALELIGRGVRVNAISPGPIATPIFERFGLPGEMAQQLRADIAAKAPTKRFGAPSDVANAALFLACDPGYIVGAEIVVDGGMSLL